MKERSSLFKIIRTIIENNRNNITINSTQESLGFDEIYPSGVIRINNNYNKIVEFDDVSYQLSHDHEKRRIFSNYASLLNSFDSTVNFQFLFVNFKLEEKENESELLEYNQNLEQFDKLRFEYLSFVEDQKKKGNNGFNRRKYLVFSVKEKNYETALRRLESIENNIKSQFRTLGSMVYSFSGNDRLEQLNYLLNGYYDESINVYDIKNEEYEDQDYIKNLISPRVMEFEKEKFKINKKYGATLYFDIQATELSDRVLVDFTNLEKEVNVSLHLKPIHQQQALKMIRTKVTDLEAIKIEEQQKSISRGYDMDLLPGNLNENISDSKSIVDELSRENERWFHLTFTVTVFDNTEIELEDSVATLKTIAQKHNCELLNLHYQQEQAYNSSLPFANNINQEELERGLTTTATASFVPFTTQELYQTDNDPVYYGLNQLSNNLIQVSRKNLKNPNALFLGTPGSGKSFSAKREMLDTFLTTTDDIIICDPEGEYDPFVELLGGEVINLALNSNSYINPLDITMEYGEGEDPIRFKSDFVITLMNVIVKRKEGLSARQRSYVDSAVHKIYRKFINTNDENDIPILRDLYNELDKIDNEEARDLVDALELFVNGSLNVFNNRTNINPQNRLISFNIQELGTNLRDLGMLILQDHVWNKVTVNRFQNKQTWYYMDEFHILLAEEQTAEYSVEFWKRFRKWGGYPTGMTQNVKDLLGSPTIETILENSDFVYLLNQAPGDRRILQEKLDISDYEANFITNSTEGEGLIIYEGTIIPFKDKFPKNNSLYPVMTTKPDEIAEFKERIANNE